MKDARTIISFDWAIKTVLRDKANADVLEGFLSALFGQKIQVLELLESESNRKNDKDKYNRVDLMAKIIRNTGASENVIIEVQYRSEFAYFKRLLYDTSSAITDNIGRGDSYDKVKKVYSVSLLYFPIEQHTDDYIYHGKTEFIGVHSKQPLQVRPRLLSKDTVSPNFQYNIFPEYFLISLSAFSGSVKDSLDEWVYSFKHSEVPDRFNAPNIGLLREKLAYMNLPQTERQEYDNYLRSWKISMGVRKDAVLEGLEEGLSIGLEEGLEQGIEKGREQGLEQGLEQGKEEGRQNALYTTAKAMLADRLPISSIAKFTGLSEEEIQTL